MRIDRLHVKNYRGFEDRPFDFPRSIDAKPEGGNGSFHLLIGDNATGKTGVLEALMVVLASFTNVFTEHWRRHFQKRDVRIVLFATGDTERLEPQLPVEVSATGRVDGNEIHWTRRLRNRRTESAADKPMRSYAKDLLARGRKDPNVVVPLISFFGTERLHRHPKDIWSRDANLSETLIPKPDGKTPEGNFIYNVKKFSDSRFVGYWHVNDARTNPDLMQTWLMVEHDLNRDRGFEAVQFKAVKDAMQRCINDCEGVKVDARLGLLVKVKEHGWLPFELLSDGQKTIAAMAGEIAWKSAQLNPLLGVDMIRKTPGIVLIDEIDLHLHPKWQRKIVECLRTTFPEMQFIATTHSPFVVQSMRQGEVIQLDERMDVIPTTANRDLETISEGLMMPSTEEPLDEMARVMGVSEPETSERYAQMKKDARSILEILEVARQTTDKGELDKLRVQVADAMSHVQQKYADDPAYQAFLELKRTSAFGE